MKKNQHLFKRLGFAFAGLLIAIKSEKSIRFQLVAAFGVFIVLILLQPPLLWWAIIILVVAVVLAAELFNTALEAICDLVHPAYHEKIKIAKDVAAAGVLMISISSIAIGLLFLYETVQP